jgi:phospholipid-translocating ATPase
MEYEILANFPFSSETKRMGIILKSKFEDKYYFYLKGAESVMNEKFNISSGTQVLDACTVLASEGLRTLVLSQKIMSVESYEAWNKSYIEAKSSPLDVQESNIRKVINSLEENMEYLGVTGVEDRLQKDVQVTIESLKQAGISVWMLTGDKVETAKCIAISSGLKSRTENFFIMSELPDDHNVLKSKLKELGNSEAGNILVIDGTVLKYCLNERIKYDFFANARKLSGVVCCRCSPLQKSQIVNEMKKFTGKRCASIGDGGNDVGMILEADVGIGIVGKEGKQASLAADFSITQFCHLKRLVLWHGRLSYTRTVSLTNFIVHRGLIISVIQTIFSLIFYFCAISVYNSYLMLGYATYYTFLPVFCLVLDEDVKDKQAMEIPSLYEELQKNRLFGTKSKLIILAQSIYQGAIIMFCTILMFKDSFVNIVIITFSALICIELLNIVSEVFY